MNAEDALGDAARGAGVSSKYELHTQVLSAMLEDEEFYADGQVVMDAVLAWQRDVRELLEYLLTLIHLSYGQPARVPELLSSLYVNSSTNSRSLFSYKSRQLILVLSHSKTLRMTGRLRRKVVRALPTGVSHILLEYLFLVRPVEILIMKADVEALSTFLFATVDGAWLYRPDAGSNGLSSVDSALST